MVSVRTRIAVLTLLHKIVLNDHLSKCKMNSPNEIELILRVQKVSKNIFYGQLL